MLGTDIIIFLASAYIAGMFVKISMQTVVLTAVLFVFPGLYVLYLKDYYKIRAFSLQDLYLIPEGVILASVIPAAIILLPGFSGGTLKFFLLNIIIITFFLLTCRSGLHLYRKHLEPAQNVVIIGLNRSAEEISRQIAARPELNFNITGKVPDFKEVDRDNKINILINATGEEIDLKNIPEDAEVHRIEEIYEKITYKVPVEYITEDWFRKNFTNIKNPVYKILKRIFDIAAALVILLVTFPVLLIISFSVKFYDSGPVLYVQNRVGKKGGTFRFYKLRTMIENADKEGMINKTEKEDERILPVCKIARKARFDEIPQMINILKGDMSIVGPRAEFEDFVREYEKEITFYNYRHMIIPGWTGWAQINQGHCTTVEDVTEKLRYDLYYIKHRNIFWDFSILLRAVFMALSGRHG